MILRLARSIRENWLAALLSPLCMIGEVSMVNDDANDNHLLNPLGRFPTIEEDEAPYRLLCNEYPAAK